MSAASIADSSQEGTFLGYNNLDRSFALSSLTTTTAYPQDSTDSTQGKALTREVVSSGLSCLGLIGNGTSIAYLHLSLQNCGLLDISLLAGYPNLQRVDLSSNQLSDVTALGSLPYLTHLNMSGNKLTKVLDFDSPKALKEADYGYNEIEEIPSLSHHQALTKLVLDGNQITVIKGLKGMVSLTHLSIADNRLERIESLDNLPLKYLNLSGNCIKKTTNLETLRLLKVLNLSSNQIHSLYGLSSHRYLQDINMEDNEVMSISEIERLEDVEMLTRLSLRRNPVQALGDYRQAVILNFPSLTCLDEQTVSSEERPDLGSTRCFPLPPAGDRNCTRTVLADCRRVIGGTYTDVAANNRFNPPISLLAAHNHIMHTSRAARKAARLRFSTLTRLDEPYPMLVLCGPPGSGKGQFCHTLVEEFPSFFGLGVSHTTRPQGARESHGRDYYFINDATFNRASDAGEFIQTYKISGHWYGLTMAAVEQVAQQGLACVTHMSIEGVLTLKNTHFEPRYILAMPLTNQIHCQRLKAREYYSDGEIAQAIEDIFIYQKLHQDRPGLFDAAINTDSLHEGYSVLRTIVMAYGGITPETPLTLSLSASRPTTHQTSSSFSTDEIPDHDTTANTTMPTTAVASTQYPPPRPSSENIGGVAGKHTRAVPPQGHANLVVIAQTWSRPSSSDGSSSVTPTQHRNGTRHTLSDPSFNSSRRREIMKAAAAGIPDNQSGGSSRPVSSYAPSADLKDMAARAGTIRDWEEEEEEDSDDDDNDDEEEYQSDSSQSSAIVH